MLNVFLFYNQPLVDALFVAVVQKLSATLTAQASSLAQARGLWRAFLQHVVVTYVPGERPGPTDSGVLFARKARQVLGIHENQILEPADALTRLWHNPELPLLLVDDFVGTGNQTIDAWHRPYPLQGDATLCFAAISEPASYICYTPLLATGRGLREISANCHGLQVCPAHILDEGYSLASRASVLWPENLKLAAPGFLFEASQRAGIVPRLGPDWKGLHQLALPLAFSHGVPDATLPLYYWRENGWKPLIRRT